MDKVDDLNKPGWISRDYQEIKKENYVGKFFHYTADNGKKNIGFVVKQTKHTLYVKWFISGYPTSPVVHYSFNPILSGFWHWD